jgi:hypothetical protein
LMLQYGIHTVLSIAQLTWVIIIFLLRLLLSLFPLDSVEFQKDSRDQPVLSPESDISAPDSDAVYSFIFWLVLLAVVVYLLRTYAKDHPELLKWLKHFRLPYSWLARFWQWLKGGAHAFIEFIPRPVTLYTEEPDPKTGLNPRRFRLGKMSTRQHIIYCYLNTLKHAEKSGLIRQQSQTPAEFATLLAKVLPDMDAEINLLTETFVHARYSRDAFSHKQALSVKRIWKNIRSELRGIQRQKIV